MKVNLALLLGKESKPSLLAVIEIEALLKSINQLNGEILDKNSELEHLKTRLEKYEKKMKDYKEVVDALDGESETFQQLHKQRESVKMLEDKSKPIQISRFSILLDFLKYNSICNS